MLLEQSAVVLYQYWVVQQPAPAPSYACLVQNLCSMDGQEDFSARIGAEDVRTALPIEEIGTKVDISVSYFWMD